MEKYSTIVGVFDSGKLKNLSEKELEEYISKREFSKDVPESILRDLKEPKYHQALRDNNILLTKIMISSTVNEDTWIIQSINSIEDLDKICNTMSKRLREWYGYYFPEASYKIEDHELFVNRIIEKTKEELLKEYDIPLSMGPDIEEKHLRNIISFARQVSDLFRQRNELLKYLEILMQNHCPNVQAVAGTMIGAKLLQKAGSLRRLSTMPSSTVQLLGAEKALFRHLRNKRIRPPKHGFILNHQYVSFAPNRDKGRNARKLAGKISIASKVDYFKGEFIGEQLREGLK